MSKIFHTTKTQIQRNWHNLKFLYCSVKVKCIVFFLFDKIQCLVGRATYVVLGIKNRTLNKKVQNLKCMCIF